MPISTLKKYSKSVSVPTKHTVKLKNLLEILGNNVLGWERAINKAAAVRIKQKEVFGVIGTRAGCSLVKKEISKAQPLKTKRPIKRIKKLKALERFLKKDIKRVFGSVNILSFDGDCF
jgi:hypothetical protein